MENLTKEQSEALYDQIRKAIRKTILLLDSSNSIWKNLRVYEYDTEKTPEANASNFLNTKGLDLWLSDVKSAAGNIDDSSRSSKYIAMLSLIELYFYFKQSVVLYTNKPSDYQFDPEVLDILTDLIHQNIQTRTFPKEDYRDILDYMYELDDEILQIRETQNETRYVNCPFMLVVTEKNESIDKDVVSVYPFQFLQNKTISYIGITIIEDCIANMFGTKHKMKDIMFEELDLSSKDEYHPVLLTGGYFTFAFQYDNTSIKIVGDNVVDSSFSVVSKYRSTANEEQKIEIAGVLASTTMIFMNKIYMVHSAFKAYIRRTPEIKIMINKIRTMTQASKIQLEKDHPSIQALNYTKYEYINDDNTGHVSKGGTHASPCEHKRSSTMRYNKKTGKRDIPVRECIVNKGKAKTQYYDNRK